MFSKNVARAFQAENGCMIMQKHSQCLVELVDYNAQGICYHSSDQFLSLKQRKGADAVIQILVI